MARRTPEQKAADQMQKLKDLGVTMSFRPAAGNESLSPLMQAMSDAATAAGINEEKSND